MAHTTYIIQEDTVVPGRFLTRFTDNSCRESWPVELVVERLQKRLEDLEAQLLALSPTVAKVDVNTATAEQLETVSGIGVATAKKIIQLREVEPFASEEDFRARLGLPEGTIVKILEQVEV